MLGTAAQKFMVALDQEQMVLSWAADIIIESYLMDSAIGRTAKLVARDGRREARYAIDATRLMFTMPYRGWTLQRRMRSRRLSKATSCR